MSEKRNLTLCDIGIPICQSLPGTHRDRNEQSGSDDKAHVSEKTIRPPDD